MAGRGDGDEVDSGREDNSLSIGERSVRGLEVGRGRGQEADPVLLYETGTPGHVVRVRVRVRGPDETKPEPVGEPLLGFGESRWIDDRGRPLAEVDQVRGVAEALVDERVHPHVGPVLKDALEE
jgi:hypothetical protein